MLAKPAHSAPHGLDISRTQAWDGISQWWGTAIGQEGEALCRKLLAQCRGVQ